VLSLAVRDAMGSGVYGDRRLLRLAARRWIRRTDEALGSFSWVRDGLGLDAELVRRRVVASGPIKRDACR